MSKTFYTERDIEDLARQGVRSLAVTDDVVLTELAVEKAERLGISLVREHGTPPSAPVRPYISPPSQPKPGSGAQGKSSREDLHQRVHAAVIARLGSELDPALLDSIIRRVLDNVGSN
jgi:hypothetical protein